MGEACYVEAVHLEDSETVECFLEMAGQDEERAVSFLAQWDFGENDGEPQGREEIAEGLLFVNRAEYGEYMAIWQTGVQGVTLYRRIAKTGRRDG